MPSLFAKATAAMHRANRRILSGVNDPDGRPLFIWWPKTSTQNKRDIASNFHEPLIAAFAGQGRREATVIDGGMPVIPRDTTVFAAELRDFPAAAPPAMGICFLAGPTLEESQFYFAQRVSRSAGLVEIEATTEP